MATIDRRTFNSALGQILVKNPWNLRFRTADQGLVDRVARPFSPFCHDFSLYGG